MYAYFQDLITTAFDFDGAARGVRKLAFAQLIVSMVVVVAIPSKILMLIGDRMRKRRAQAALYADVTRNLPAGASAQLIGDLVAQEQANRRRAYAAPLLPPIALAAEPADGSYFVTLREFADEKKQSGAAMNVYEHEAAGPAAFLYDSFGPQGFGCFDACVATPPYRSHELRAVLERLGLAEFTNAVDAAFSIHLRRFQLYQDFTATGMPAEQARAHPDMQTYAPLDNSIRVAGGRARFLRAADQYFQAAYPWVPDSGF